MSIKIEVLQIRNFKRVTLAEVSFGPDGLTVIGGANGQGKSTFLSAIQALLGGAKYMPSQPHNLEAGGATAVIRAKLSNGIEVERSGKSSTLKVVVDGQKGNQSTLNEFLNEFALDINRFMRGTDKERADLLIKHIGIGEKLEALSSGKRSSTMSARWYPVMPSGKSNLPTRFRHMRRPRWNGSTCAS
jgi:recombinational DNA repair ATPase RecF